MNDLYTARTPYELSRVCSDLIAEFGAGSGAIVLLDGDLGAGKTEFVRQFFKAFFGDWLENLVASPTFAIMHEYVDNFRHIDMYRIDENQSMIAEIFELLHNGGWIFIEWANDEVKKYIIDYKLPFITIAIEVVDNERILRVIK
ncbi:MAG: tRNA (adenosine(37)-N6)-threonylcarbamoyltransferase complex ATPase subunit type 1 TsaE [Helicobacteraceae bacterium]|jgi:tRNA threonylcarbamoyladenosine biosynthesis protein TsaE|nr:tRNA (adenosine(37)-N6)-threonylcarbamoyltransferase complex ATPase subunit type 1 TsaE [Helicobacteraceae bacterium]